MIKLKWIICTSVLIASCLPLAAQFAGGSGTANDPYLVASAYQLSYVHNYTSSHFLQIADIDLNQPPWNTGIGWQSINFNGYYDGGYHHISNLMVNRPGSVYYNGLFNGGIDIRNIILDNFNIYGGLQAGGIAAKMDGGTIVNCTVQGTIQGLAADYTHAGGIVGNTFNGTVIENCHANVTITGASACGGLVGRFNNPSGEGSITNCTASGSLTGENAGGITSAINGGTLTNCSSSCYVSALEYAGGIAGGAMHATLTNCRNTGQVVVDSGGYNAGGLLGVLHASSAYGCSSSGHVTGSMEFSEAAGGLIGSITGVSDYQTLVQGCYATGAVNGYKAGGLIGIVDGWSGAVLIQDCYAKGNASAESMAGGIVGYALGLDGAAQNLAFTNCFSTGAATTQLPWGSGGFGGSMYGDMQFSNCYWNTDTSGHISAFYDDNPTGVYPRNTQQMTYPYATNTYVNWDFGGIWSIDDSFSYNNGYPYLFGDNDPGIVEQVLFNPPAGNYYQPFYLSLICHTSNSQIYYTTDGTDPTESSWHFQAEIVVNTSVTIKARAFRNNWEPSEISTAVYIFPSDSPDDSTPEVDSKVSIYPNPFSQSTTIKYGLAQASPTSVCIYNLKGQAVRNLEQSIKSTGVHSVIWDGCNDKGSHLSSGIYYCVVLSKGTRYVSKLLLLR